jgi:hypothetical protein
MGAEFESWNTSWVAGASIEKLRRAVDFARRASNGCEAKEHKQVWITEYLNLSRELVARTGRHS